MRGPRKPLLDWRNLAALVFMVAVGWTVHHFALIGANAALAPLFPKPAAPTYRVLSVTPDPPGTPPIKGYRILAVDGVPVTGSAPSPAPQLQPQPGR